MKRLIVLATLVVMAVIAYAQALTPQQDSKKGKWGYVDNTGKWVVKPKYDNAEAFKDGLGRVEKEGTFGFIGEKGKEVLSCKYSRAIAAGDVIYAQEKDRPEKWVYFHPSSGNAFDLYDVVIEDKAEGCHLMSYKFDVSYDKYSTSVLLFDKDWKYIYGADSASDKDGFLVFNRKIKQDNTYLDLYAVFTYDGKFMVANTKDPVKELSIGIRITGYQSIDVKQFGKYEGPKLVSVLYSPEKELWSFVKEGEDWSNTVENSNIVTNGKKYRITNDGKSAWRGSGDYDFVVKGEYSNHLAYYFTFRDGKWGWIGSDGDKEIPCTFLGTKDYVPFSEHTELTFWCYNSINKTWGVIERESGKVIVPCEYDSISGFHDTYIGYKNGRATDAYTNENFPTYKKTTIQGNYEFVSYERGWFTVKDKSNGKLGILNDDTFSVLIPARYYSIDKKTYTMDGEIATANFCGDYFRVKRTKNDKPGVYVDGKQVIPCGIYDQIGIIGDNNQYGYFVINFFPVWKNGKVGLVNSHGKLVIPIQYEGINKTLSHIVFMNSTSSGALSVSVFNPRSCRIVATRTFNNPRSYEFYNFMSSYK